MLVTCVRISVLNMKSMNLFWENINGPHGHRKRGNLDKNPWKKIETTLKNFLHKEPS